MIGATSTEGFLVPTALGNVNSSFFNWAKRFTRTSRGGILFPVSRSASEVKRESSRLSMNASHDDR